jgi:hypothetical protein
VAGVDTVMTFMEDSIDSHFVHYDQNRVMFVSVVDEAIKQGESAFSIGSLPNTNKI